MILPLLADRTCKRTAGDARTYTAPDPYPAAGHSCRCFKAGDLMAAAQTGTGKTLALPCLCSRRLPNKARAFARVRRACVDTGTHLRELAEQLLQSFSSSLRSALRTYAGYGGVRFNRRMIGLAARVPSCAGRHP